MLKLRYYFPGMTLILVAIAILLVPEILVAFVAATIIMAGIGLLYVGHMIRKSEIDLDDSRAWLHDDGFFRFRFARAPLFRRRDWPF